jgi:hypothetical protein
MQKHKKLKEQGRTDRSKAPNQPPNPGCSRARLLPVRLLPVRLLLQIHPGTPPSAKGIKLHRLKSPVYTHTDPFPCQVARKCHEILTIS